MAGAGWFASTGVAGLSGLAAVGIGAAVTLAVGTIVVGYNAHWKREDA